MLARRLADFEDCVAPERLRPLRRLEYDKMAEQGAFGDERVELLQGLLIEMSPQNPRHAAVIQRLNDRLAPALAGRASVRVQLPLAISDDSEPEPDLAVVAPGDYDQQHPRTAHLVIEVAETSLQKDRRLKGALYAHAGVSEYWVVNLVDRVIEVQTGPADGVYRATTIRRLGEAIRLAAFSDVEIRVGDILR